MTVSYVTYQLHKNMAHNNGDRMVIGLSTHAASCTMSVEPGFDAGKIARIEEM